MIQECLMFIIVSILIKMTIFAEIKEKLTGCSIFKKMQKLGDQDGKMYNLRVLSSILVIDDLRTTIKI